jgi:hypothetical protein
VTRRLLCCGLILAYIFLVFPFAELQKSRPVEVKLGYLPHAQLLKIAGGEHRATVAGLIVMRVLFYFGTVLQKLKEKVVVQPEFLNMYRTIQSIVDLDPYNMDSYYFAQAVFTWDLGRVREVNALLEQGMERRSWDPTLPFYLGFNHAYFLKDYASGAKFMQIAAERSGNPFYAQLAARFFYESEQSTLGLAFLETMIQSAKDKAVRRNYELRRDALLASRAIEQARDAYRSQFGALPVRVEQLVEAGLLATLPEDPYGGTFYIDDGGRVRTTSKLVETKSLIPEIDGHESN